MVDAKDFGAFETAWCPGCGNFGLLDAMKKALAESGLRPRDVLFVSGIGQAAKAPHYLRCNVFNGLHGRGLPVATGAKLADPGLHVIYESGDGCTFGEGGNHFLAALRRNVGVTAVVHDNRVYGLTKGQASPTTAEGFVTKAQPAPAGTLSRPFNPLAVAIVHRPALVARGFTGMPDHLAGLLVRALSTKGFALLDVLQPCVSFNKVNTHRWFMERCAEIGPEHDARDPAAALALALEEGDRIPVGVFYENPEALPFEERVPALRAGPLVGRPVDREALQAVIDGYR